MDESSTVRPSDGSPPTGNPEISVVICTHNRAGYLDDAVASVLNQEIPPEDYEIIIVDNGSTDWTREVVNRLEATGRIRSVFEPRLGVSHARNAGWRNARGKYIAYLDDDEMASPGWLKAVRESFAFRSAPAVIGGRVEPLWDGDPPAWLSENLSRALGILHWSDTPKVLTDIRMEWLGSGNMAVPLTLFKEIGPFDSRLGRTRTRLLSGEDTFFQKRVMQRGYECVYCPDMLVYHRIPRSRLTKRWFRSRFFMQGISDAQVLLIEQSPSVVRRAVLGLEAAARLMFSPATWVRLSVPTDDPRRYQEKCFTWISVGYVAGLLGAAGK